MVKQALGMDFRVIYGAFSEFWEYYNLKRSENNMQCLRGWRVMGKITSFYHKKIPILCLCYKITVIT